MTPTNEKGISRKPTEGDVRCECKKLLGRRRPQGFEVKCDRCKRIHLVSWHDKSCQ